MKWLSVCLQLMENTYIDEDSRVLVVDAHDDILHNQFALKVGVVQLACFNVEVKLINELNLLDLVIDLFALSLNLFLSMISELIRPNDEHVFEVWGVEVSQEFKQFSSEITSFTHDLVLVMVQDIIEESGWDVSSINLLSVELGLKHQSDKTNSLFLSVWIE